MTSLLLVRVDVDADSKDPNGRMPVSFAARRGHSEISYYSHEQYLTHVKCYRNIKKNTIIGLYRGSPRWGVVKAVVIVPS